MTESAIRFRWFRWSAFGLAMIFVGAVVAWAGLTVLSPPEDVLAETTYTTVEVTTGEVGSSISLNTIAEWTTVSLGSNLAAGTVTTVDVQAGQEVAAGARLYSVNLRPVVVAQGSIPAFQEISAGATGVDVHQVQLMLASIGYYSGVADGKFGRTTTAAVQKWQKQLGVAADGIVRQGDIIFVPTLPTRIALDTELVKRGAILAGGEEVVNGLPPSPTFMMPVTESQAFLMPSGTRVEIAGPDGARWDGFVESHVEDADGGLSVTLAGKDGSVICGEACATIPVTGRSQLSSRIVTVESVTGLTVPTAALLSRPDGSIAVTDKAGLQHAVTLVTSARGMSIVKGIQEGTRVRIPADED